MKAFLSATADDAARFVSAVLRKSGVEVVDAFSVEPGQDLRSALRDRIASADIFVVLLRPPADWQMFEMGVASALGKPIAVVADPACSLPPVVRADFVIHSPLTDERLLRSFIETVARKVPRGGGIERPSPMARVDQPRVQQLLDRVRELRATPDWRALERLVADLFASTGLSAPSTFEMHAVADNREADAIVHAPAIAPLLGSPLLVEVKAGPLTGRRLEETLNGMVAKFAAFGCRTGLLLYLDERGRRLPAMPHPHVLAIDIEDLLGAMLDTPFEKVLVTIRNNAVHGA